MKKDEDEEQDLPEYFKLVDLARFKTLNFAFLMRSSVCVLDGINF